MKSCRRTLILCLCLLFSVSGRAAVPGEVPSMPPWQVLEFERKAFWATAKSRMELPQPAAGENTWGFLANSSVMSNSEQVYLRFDPWDARVRVRMRLSEGSNQRLKVFGYGEKYVHRHRRNPDGKPVASPGDWPVTSRKRLSYPAGTEGLTVTSPYLLMYLAQTLYEQGPGAATEVLVHTDINFYRVKLRCESGPIISVDYQSAGEGHHKGKQRTTAVTIEASPAGELAEDDDFDLLGLHGEITVLFDQASGVPVKVRGSAPRIGETSINLRSVTMRPQPT